MAISIEELDKCMALVNDPEDFKLKNYKNKVKQCYTCLTELLEMEKETTETKKQISLIENLKQSLKSAKIPKKAPIAAAFNEFIKNKSEEYQNTPLKEASNSNIKKLITINEKVEESYHNLLTEYVKAKNDIEKDFKTFSFQSGSVFQATPSKDINSFEEQKEISMGSLKNRCFQKNKANVKVNAHCKVIQKNVCSYKAEVPIIHQANVFKYHQMNQIIINGAPFPNDIASLNQLIDEPLVFLQIYKYCKKNKLEKVNIIEEFEKQFIKIAFRMVSITYTPITETPIHKLFAHLMNQYQISYEDALSITCTLGNNNITSLFALNNSPKMAQSLMTILLFSGALFMKNKYAQDILDSTTRQLIMKMLYTADKYKLCNLTSIICSLCSNGTLNYQCFIDVISFLKHSGNNIPLDWGKMQSNTLSIVQYIQIISNNKDIEEGLNNADILLQCIPLIFGIKINFIKFTEKGGQLLTTFYSNEDIPNLLSQNKEMKSINLISIKNEYFLGLQGNEQNKREISFLCNQNIKQSKYEFIQILLETNAVQRIGKESLIKCPICSNPVKIANHILMPQDIYATIAEWQAMQGN